MCSWEISEENSPKVLMCILNKNSFIWQYVAEKFLKRISLEGLMWIMKTNFIRLSMCSRGISEKNSLESLMCIAFILISKLPLMATVDLKNQPVLWTKIHSFILEAVVKQIIWTKVHSFVNIKARGFWKELIPLDLKLADFWIVRIWCL